MDLGLRGRVAFITGASRNIGMATALAFAAEGTSVVVTTRRSVDELDRLAARLTTPSSRALALRCDITDVRSVDRAVGTALDQLGRIDIVVNNAVHRCETPLQDVSDDEWGTNLAVNLSGVMHVCRAVAPHMVQAGFGRIVNFSGVAAEMGLGAAKAAVKAGIVGLTRGLAQEMFATGVTVNCIAPGLIDVVRDDDRERKLPRSNQPVQRMGSVDEVAAMVLWLSSTQAAFVTGQTLRVNGGAVFG